MPDAFVRPVVHIDKERLPVSSQRIVVYGITMILAGDKAPLRPDHAHRLVMAAVAVFQFIDRSAACLGKQLVSHADAADRFVSGKRLADMLNSHIAGIRVAGTVRDEKPVVVQRVEVIVPGDADNGHIPFQQAAYDVCFHTTVEEHDTLFPFSFSIGDNFFTAYTVDVVDTPVIRHFEWHVKATRLHIQSGNASVFHSRLIVDQNASHHHPMFTYLFCQCTRIDTCDSGNHFPFQPVAQAFHGIPMTMLFAIIAHNNCLRMDFLTLHKRRQIVLFDRERRHPVVSDQRIGQHHQLTGIRRIGKAFRITGHGSIEHHFAGYRLIVTKREAVKLASVIQNQCRCFSNLHISFN